MNDIEKIFSLSPTLFFEVARIVANTSFCVLPQQVFTFKFNNLRLLNSIFSYIAGEIDCKKLESEINYIEREAINFLKKDDLSKILHNLDMEVIPFCTIVDRILNSEETPIFPTIYYYVYKKGKRERVEEVLHKIRAFEIEVLSENELEKRLEIVKLEGKLLGYPECCINEFLDLKKRAILNNYSLSPEKKTILELLESGLLNKFHELLENIDSFEYVYSLFSLNFYPCSIFCKKAIKIGKTCNDHLDKNNRAYRCGLIFNTFYHIATGYKSYTISKRKDSEYLKKISIYYNNLKPDVQEILEASKNVLSDKDFINNFIYKCSKII